MRQVIVPCSNPPVTCPLCSVPGEKLLVTQLNGYRVFSCTSCAGEFVVPLPGDDVLDTTYHGFSAGANVREEFDEYVEQAAAVLDKQLSHLPIFRNRTSKRDIRFLDYGCGAGHFVAAASMLGMDSFGLEIDRESVEFAQARGLRVYEGHLPDKCPYQLGGGFDVIKMMHVLEHVPHPFEVLRSVIALLDEGGVLLIDVPDHSSFPALLKKAVRLVGLKRSEWGYVQPPIHLHGFRPATLQRIARSFQLEVLRLESTSPLDNQSFPSTPKYWRGMLLHRLVYRLGRVMGSRGYITAAFKKGPRNPRPDSSEHTDGF